MGYVFFGYVGGQWEVDPSLSQDRTGGDVQVRDTDFLLGFPDCLIQQLGVELETNCVDIATLLRTEDVARPANLQVAHGDAETRAQFRRFQHSRQPLASGLGDASPRGRQQVGVGPLGGTTHTAS